MWAQFQNFTQTQQQRLRQTRCIDRGGKMTGKCGNDLVKKDNGERWRVSTVFLATARNCGDKTHRYDRVSFPDERRAKTGNCAKKSRDSKSIPFLALVSDIRSSRFDSTNRKKRKARYILYHVQKVGLGYVVD